MLAFYKNICTLSLSLVGSIKRGWRLQFPGDTHFVWIPFHDTIFENQACYLFLFYFKFRALNKKSKRGILGILLIISLLHMIGLLGTSNSLVWGIDECVNTHHFFHIWATETVKNTLKSLKMYKNIIWLCFYKFQGKTNNKWHNLHFSPWTFIIWQI